MTICVSAKFILAGEHFVLYGCPALALPWSEAKLSLSKSCIELPPPSTILLEAWQMACRLLSIPTPQRFPFVIRSDIPVGCGFGSSAALCVALLKAAAQEAGLHLCSTELIAHATDLEALFHGRSSGIDPSVVVLERPLRFELGQRPQPWSWQLQGLGFVLAVSGEQRNSATAIAKVREFSGGHPTKFEQLLKQAHSIVEQIQDLCQTPTYSPSQLAATGQSLGILLNRHHKLLADLGVSSPLLETLAATARQNGAWGAKLTGAGMGGGLIALAYHKNLAHIAQALRYQGAQEVYIYEPSIN